MTESEESERARSLCLRYLSRRDYSRHELVQRLQAKGLAKVAAAEVIDRLAEVGVQSDERFAASLLRRRVEQGYGWARIRAELRQLGIDDALIDPSLYDWDAVMERAHRKRYSARVPKTAAELASHRRFLGQRGFSAEQIQRLLRRFGADPDDLA